MEPVGLPTFDLECINWTIPIAVGFFDGYEYREFVKEDEKDDIVWRFLQFLNTYYQGIKLYAHCASKFDNKFILSSLLNHNEEVSLEAGLIRLKWKNPNISFEDSYLVIPMALARANKIFGVESKKDWDHSKTKDPWAMGSKLPTFLSYLKTDCMSLSHLMGKVCELTGETFGVMPSISLSTTAAKVFSKLFYPLDEVDSNEGFEEYIREAIYGGRNEVYKQYGENINIYDIKGMYVSCYDQPVPIGRLRWIKPNIDKGTLAEADVKVPKDWIIGPLPKKVLGRLVFPVSEFRGWWDTTELRNAAEVGVDVTIRRQLYTEEEPILESFGKFVGTLRGNKQDEFWKMFGLALSGKLGQGRIRDITRHINDIKSLKGWTPLDEGEIYYSSKEYIGGRAPYIKPAIAMRIRAVARIKHFGILTEAKRLGDIFYGDTDSVHTTANLPTGDKVGDLTLIGKAERGYYIRQKLYSYISKGRLIQKSAGYSDSKLSEEDFKKLLKGIPLGKEETAFPSLKRILKSKEVELYKRGRILKAHTSLDNREGKVGDYLKPIELIQGSR